MSSYHDRQLAEAQKVLTTHDAKKADIRHALWQALDSAYHYRRETQKAEPLMTAIETLVKDIVDERVRDG